MLDVNVWTLVLTTKYGHLHYLFVFVFWAIIIFYDCLTFLGHLLFEIIFSFMVVFIFRISSIS